MTFTPTALQEQMWYSACQGQALDRHGPERREGESFRHCMSMLGYGR